MKKPLIGITPDVLDRDGRVTSRVAETYAVCVERAGGVPVVLSPSVGLIYGYVDGLDGFVLTGGDDPVMEEFGEPTHPAAVRVHPRRQAFEVALLRALAERAPAKPVLGVCLGMQYMGLVAGAALDQHMPETMGEAEAGGHWEAEHAVVRASDGWAFGEGVVHSKHRQRLADGGSLHVLARSDDGVVEAVGDPGRGFYVGVQWHPERTAEAGVGQALFDGLVGACGS